jgi:hypothetical protein
VGLYIDVGNSYRSGQVLYQIQDWEGDYIGTSRIASFFPQIYKPGPEDTEQPDCAGLQGDTQTLAANNMGAAMAVNTLCALLDGVPLTGAGWLYSTTGSVKEIPFTHVDHSGLIVSKVFADPPPSGGTMRSHSPGTIDPAHHTREDIGL